MQPNILYLNSLASETGSISQDMNMTYGVLYVPVANRRVCFSCAPCAPGRQPVRHSGTGLWF
jgi:hypothetical protein